MIDKVESRLRLAETTSSAERERLYLAGDFLSWLLTSTNRLLRDSATRALYWFGRCFPARLFAQTPRSLTVNDPYVPERMLAACYGVTMAFYRSHGGEEFGKRTLPEFATQLYRAMFASKAGFATTHALMRDFARHVLDLAVLLHPKLFSTRERRRFTPPYREGGIRRLKVGKDRNPKEYRDGNFPLGMDFHNYTLGRLVRKRNNYDFKHPGFRKVVEHVWWRIYDLGYSLETFGEIDKQIVRAHWRISRSEDNASRIDRYGKKYAWIAFYELYGLFRDKGLLQDDWVDADGRTSDVDIEPSFPHPPHSISILNECFLGPSNITAREWIEHPATADLRPYLLLNELDREAGPWILVAVWCSRHPITVFDMRSLERCRGVKLSRLTE